MKLREIFRPLHNRLLRHMAASGLLLFVNSSAMCTSYKVELMLGMHAHGTTVTRGTNAADAFKMALYLASGSLGAGTTAYSVTSEITGTNYTAGGVTLTNATAPTSSGTTAFWTPSASAVWTNLTQATAFDAALVYNSTQSNRACSVHNFGSQTVTAGNFTLTMPANDATNALLRIA